MTNVSVIICGYTEERWEQMIAAIQSLRQQTLPPSEIIFVSDHNPRLFQRIQNEFDDVITVENQGQRGLSDSRNTGIQVSKGSKIAFLDDDAVATPDWLKLLIHWCDQPNVMGAGSFIAPIWMNHKPKWFPNEFYWTVGCSHKGLPEVASPVRNMFGASMCIRREVFDKVGLFRVGVGRIGNLLAGCEETELCIRANNFWKDKRFILEPEAIVYHYLPKNREAFSYFIRRCYWEGRSKALLSHLLGSRSSLETERDYTFKTLPSGVLRNIKEAITRFDLGGLLRATAIVTGLFVTTIGYLSGLWIIQITHPTSPYVIEDKEAVGK